ncbi:MAG: hypothetical protein JWM27_197 [Gemmatimonadetes bacterium]|nr:hypothetical protein [Gemmatimonadota bacterium]
MPDDPTLRVRGGRGTLRGRRRPAILEASLPETRDDRSAPPSRHAHAARSAPRPPPRPRAAHPVKDRLRVASVALAAIVVFNLGREGYRWYAFRDERAAIVRLRRHVVEAGAEVTLTRGQLEALNRAVGTADSGLTADVQVLRRYAVQSDGGLLPPAVYARYLRDRRRYDEHRAQRQEVSRRWEEVQGRLHASADWYNVLADSIRTLATRIGDPYYHVPLPVEAAAEKGLIKVDSGRSNE